MVASTLAALATPPAVSHDGTSASAPATPLQSQLHFQTPLFPNASSRESATPPSTPHAAPSNRASVTARPAPEHETEGAGDAEEAEAEAEESSDGVDAAAALHAAV